MSEKTFRPMLTYSDEFHRAGAKGWGRKKLGYWIAQQRGIRKGTRKHSIILDDEKVAKLDELGMDWNPSNARKLNVVKAIRANRCNNL